MTGAQAAALLRLHADLFLLMEEDAARTEAEPEPETPRRRKRAPSAPRTIVGEL